VAPTLVVGCDSQLANMALQAKEVLGAEHLAAVADRGYFNSPRFWPAS
jgi:hypothetical protein